MKFRLFSCLTQRHREENLTTFSVVAVQAAVVKVVNLIFIVRLEEVMEDLENALAAMQNHFLRLKESIQICLAMHGV